MRLFETLNEVGEAIDQAGLERWRGSLLAVARPTIRYVAEPQLSACTEVSVSRIGGTPDLPSWIDWPRRPPYADSSNRHLGFGTEDLSLEFRALFQRRDQIKGQEAYLPFLAQIDLAEAWGVQQFDIDLPKSGRLLFFYDVREIPTGDEPTDAVGFRVIWDDTPVSDLARAVAPEELLLDYLVFQEKKLSLSSGYVLPGWQTFAYEGTGIPLDELDKYSKLLCPYEDALISGHYDQVPELALLPQHSLGGWGKVHQQGYMEVRCELARNVVSTRIDEVFHENKERVRLQHSDWCLLAQLDCAEFDKPPPEWSAEALPYEWFTHHKLYFWIRRQELSSRCFEGVWVVAQNV